MVLGENMDNDKFRALVTILLCAVAGQIISLLVLYEPEDLYICLYVNDSYVPDNAVREYENVSSLPLRCDLWCTYGVMMDPIEYCYVYDPETGTIVEDFGKCEYDGWCYAYKPTCSLGGSWTPTKTGRYWFIGEGFAWKQTDVDCSGQTDQWCCEALGYTYGEDCLTPADGWKECVNSPHCVRCGFYCQELAYYFAIVYIDILSLAPTGGGGGGAGVTCVDECTSGSKGCVNETARWYCGEANDGDPCLEKIVVKCPEGEVCKDGECVEKSALSGLWDTWKELLSKLLNREVSDTEAAIALLAVLFIFAALTRRR